MTISQRQKAKMSKNLAPNPASCVFIDPNASNYERALAEAALSYLKENCSEEDEDCDRKVA